jgi:Spy/CpxP family protein refolding chaperone
MKKLLLLCFLFTGTALHALCDDTSNLSADPSTSAPSDGSTNGAAGEQGQRGERWKAALAQLNLSDAQKEQIKQIRATVTDRKERRQQVLAVLTADQKAQLKALWQARRAQAGPGQASGSGAN